MFSEVRGVPRQGWKGKPGQIRPIPFAYDPICPVPIFASKDVFGMQSGISHLECATPPPRLRTGAEGVPRDGVQIGFGAASREWMGVRTWNQRVLCWSTADTKQVQIYKATSTYSLVAVSHVSWKSPKRGWDVNILGTRYESNFVCPTKVVS